MCGRYFLTRPPAALARLFRTVDPVPNHPARFNVAPTQTSLVVRRNPETGARHLDLLRWGLVPLWAKDAAIGSRMINARSESLAEKPAYRDAYAKRRCLVPIDGFYEWAEIPGEKRKQPYAVAMESGAPMVLAGLWERWRAPDQSILRTFTVVTCPAAPRLVPLHDRMPVVLPPEAWPLWLREVEGDAASVLRPMDGAAFRIWPVSTRVNGVREDDDGLIARDPDVTPLAGLGVAEGPPAFGED
ncbi:SOS response-associated peptidase [Elioraea sp.]|uniref:SOS response-associated peptidase n=1 Tax=Elioraea sp. TaxID=2185103 RepID=UPI0025C3E34B|nr:SOS response-associated peptidase [Elioraea sp.]